MIDRQEALAELLPHVEAGTWVALDTEADSLHAYPEKLCLIQMSLADGHFLIDPLAGCDLLPLLGILRTKELIMHGADYDLRLLHRAFQFVPGTIFDTMWAARLLGYREFSLSDLVQRHLGVVLEKGPQKMNWALRPLSERMSTYALNDTRYLRPLGEILRGELQTKGRSPWLEEACIRVVSEAARGRQLDPDSVWRVKGSDRLAPPAMALVRELWRWREEEARAVNKPPYFILSHENLVALSDAVSRGRPTRNLIPHHVPAKRVDRLRLAIQRGLEVPESEYPQPRRSAGVRLSRAEQGQFDELKRTRDASADQHGLDPTVIASKADLVGLAKDRANGIELMTWQRQLLELE